MCATRLAKEFPEMALLVGCKRLRTIAAPVPVLEKTLPRLVGMSPSRSFSPLDLSSAPQAVWFNVIHEAPLGLLGLGIVGHVVGTEASVKFYRCQFRMRRSTQRELGKAWFCHQLLEFPAAPEAESDPLRHFTKRLRFSFVRSL